MGLTRSDIFTAEQNELANLAKALGHPARIAIVQHLIKVNACICGDLVDEIGLAQPTISQHLKALKSVGILQGNIEGTSVCYCINKQRWQEIQGLLLGFLATVSQSVNCC